LSLRHVFIPFNIESRIVHGGSDDGIVGILQFWQVQERLLCFTC
jgi:hypothetical protein